MSDPIGRVGGSGFIDTTDNNQEPNRTEGVFGPGRAPNPSDRHVNVSLKGAIVSMYSPIPDNYKTAIDMIKQPKPSNSFKNKLGRAILWIVNLFKGVKSSKTLSTEEKLDSLRNKKALPLPDNVVNKGRPYSASLGQYANLCGFDSKGMKVDYFYDYKKEPDKDYRQVLFPKGEPRLADIKQNPELQDCWFLSAITATLHTQGTESIERLFSESKTPGNVVIRLGTNLYDVPMGRIASSGGDRFGSNSAPWVVALENAMLIHLSLSEDNPDINNPKAIEVYKRRIQMPLRSANEGVVALRGCSYTGENTGIKKIGLNFTSAQDGYEAISTLLSRGKPVVIGHNGYNQKDVALRDGIAPNHAVTVLEVIPMGFKVLDPYGQVKTLNKESIVDYTMFSIRETDEPDEDYAFTFTKDVDLPEEAQKSIENKDNDF